MLLALSPHASFNAPLIGSLALRSDPHTPVSIHTDVYGNLISRLVAPAGGMRIWSDCVIVHDGRPEPTAPGAAQIPVENLPFETLKYLTPSRYVESDALVAEAWKLFGHTAPGWDRVQAICDFVHGHLTFGYKHGRPTKTAMDAFREKNGVCRDFAHLAIALCRAMNIPARYASGYLGDIDAPPSGPGDFSAWFEVFLGGEWHTLDARYNTPRIGRILMVRGHDAADVAFITSFGSVTLTGFRVWTDELPAGMDEAVARHALGTLPAPTTPPIIPSAWPTPVP
jgi:transglutaminase-like putative cysteine protease